MLKWIKVREPGVARSQQKNQDAVTRLQEQELEEENDSGMERELESPASSMRPSSIASSNDSSSYLSDLKKVTS